MFPSPTSFSKTLWLDWIQNQNVSLSISRPYIFGDLRKADGLATSVSQTLNCPRIPLTPPSGYLSTSAWIYEINFELLLQGPTAYGIPLFTAGAQYLQVLDWKCTFFTSALNSYQPAF